MTYTAPRTAQVFDHTTVEAEVGDYFRLPQQPIVRVIARFDIGDYVAYQVQAGQEKPQYWEIMKPEAELQEQERYRLQDEIEMSDIIHAASQEEIEQALGLLLPEFNWFTGMTEEQQAEALPPIETGYHDDNWTSNGCEF